MNKFLLYILLSSLAINLTLAFIASTDESRFVDPDSEEYISLADNLAACNGYTTGQEPEIFRAPGYPFFMTPLRYLFPDSLLPIIILQCLISTATIYLLWHLTLMLTGNNFLIAKFATIIQTVSLASLVFTNKILSEILFTFFLLLFFFLIEKTIQSFKNYSKSESKNRRNIYLTTFAAGVSAGLLVFVRAIFMPFFPLFLLYTFYNFQKFRYLRSHNTKGVFKYMIPNKMIISLISLIIIPFMIIIGGWSIRNSITADYKGFSSVGSINIYRYYACLLLSKNNNRSFEEQQGICDANLDAAGSQPNQAEYSVKHGLPIIMKEPFRYFFLHLKTDLNNLLPAVGDFYTLIGHNIGGKGTLSVIHSKGILAGVKHYFAGNMGLFIAALPLVLLLLLKYLLSITGFIQKVYKEKNLTMMLYTLFAVYMIVVPGAVSHPRFRVPVEPFLSLFGAIGLFCIMTVIKNRRKKA